MTIRELIEVINPHQEIMIIADCVLGFIRYASCRDIPPALLGATVLEVAPRSNGKELLIECEIACGIKGEG